MSRPTGLTYKKSSEKRKHFRILLKRYAESFADDVLLSCPGVKKPELLSFDMAPRIVDARHLYLATLYHMVLLGASMVAVAEQFGTTSPTVLGALRKVDDALRYDENPVLKRKALRLCAHLEVSPDWFLLSKQKK